MSASIGVTCNRLRSARNVRFLSYWPLESCASERIVAAVCAASNGPYGSGVCPHPRRRATSPARGEVFLRKGVGDDRAECRFIAVARLVSADERGLAAG